MIGFRIVLFKIIFTITFLLLNVHLSAQVRWTKINVAYDPLPIGFNVYKTTDSLDGKPFKAIYAIADLKNKKLKFTTDTTLKRRLTPAQFFEKNRKPLLVVNTTFFSFSTNQNLNIVLKDGKLVSYNIHSVPGQGKDTLTYRHPLGGALGISKKYEADVAWIFTDSSKKIAYASQKVTPVWSNAESQPSLKDMQLNAAINGKQTDLKKWKMQTAVGGGPVLVQNGRVNITNNEELKFAGRAINDLHPRTLMGYTKSNQLIVMVIEGRNPGIAEGASLMQAAKLMTALGCTEALNLDGGGSSCMLINGKETIKPSDKGLERPVPAVFIVQEKEKL